MCGIAGTIDFGRKTDEALLERMAGLIRHRGPDATGIYMDDTAGMVSVRLSILDLAGGDQPIHNEDETIWIVYNGEVFNYVELRPSLEAKGHRFSTNTDTEVLVHLYEEKGPAMLRDLNGQFGLAIWDRKKRSLFLARDRMGIRPLFYFLDGNRLVFGSEIKAILADSGIERRLDPQTLSDVFTCWSALNESTPFKGIRQLLPGHYAIFDQEGMESRQYWRIPFEKTADRDGSVGDWTGELTELLHDACRIRLRADVPVGAYLSGGLDSTCITSMVKNRFNNELRTFSVAFSDSRFDETFFQSRAVQSLNTEHSSIRCTERDIGESFPDVIWHAETPLLRTAPVPMFLLSGLVRKNSFKVVLTGEGSDEIFAGYDIFKEDRVRRFWARRPDSAVRPRLLRKLYPDIFGQSDGRSGAFLEGFFKKGLLSLDSPVYSHMIRWQNTALLKAFFSDDLCSGADRGTSLIDRYTASLPQDFMSWDPLSRAQYTESTIFLSNYLLSSQGDRMAMAHAVEGRYPFLDYRMVEFATRVPARFRLCGLKDKFVLREAAREWIPPELATRPKQPYRAPISRCFFGDRPMEYAQELLSEEQLRQKGYFHPGKVAKLVDKVKKQEGHLLSERENMALIGILSTQLLDEQFVKDFPGRPAPDPGRVRSFDFREKA
jgi:asparagine synthase (glutamine-hydrolysing)